MGSNPVLDDFAKLPRTRMAIMRTISSLHVEPLHYDLECLSSLVLNLAPDLLCADITREAWERGDLSGVPLEVREALAPAIALTDTVLVPVAPTSQQFNDFYAPSGLRAWISHRFDRLLRWGQRVANGPEAIHGLVFKAFCHTVCALEEMTWKRADRQAYERRMQALAENILEAVQRDPGGRVLVVVQCQCLHKLEPLLKKAEDWLKIVDYREL